MKQKYDYRELYRYAKEFGRKETMETFGASDALINYVVAIGDAILENRPLKKDTKPLCEYTPRELMQEFARRGYEGKLQFKQIIDITNF